MILTKEWWIGFGVGVGVCSVIICILVCYFRSVIKAKNEKIEHGEKEIAQHKVDFDGLSKGFKHNQELKDEIASHLAKEQSEHADTKRLLSKWKWRFWILFLFTVAIIGSIWWIHGCALVCDSLLKTGQQIYTFIRSKL